jgi:hypothetical protein
MKTIFIIISFLLLIACATSLNKDGSYEIATDKVKVTLELPCRDSLSQEFDSFLNSLYQQASSENKITQFENLAMGKLIIENKTDLYLKEGFSPAKIILNLQDGSTIEGIRIEKMFDTLDYEMASLGKTWKLPYIQGKNEYSQKLMNESWVLTLMDTGAAGSTFLKARDDYAALSKENLSTILIAKLTIGNKGQADIKNLSGASNFSIQIIKQNKEKIHLLPLAELVTPLQQLCDEKMKTQIKNAALYNDYVGLYNGFAEAMKTALSERKELIKPGEYSSDYFGIENIGLADIASIEVTGGSFGSASLELKRKMLKDYVMPVDAKSQSSMYIAFPNFDAAKIKIIYFSMGNYQAAMK